MSMNSFLDHYSGLDVSQQTFSYMLHGCLNSFLVDDNKLSVFCNDFTISTNNLAPPSAGKKRNNAIQHDVFPLPCVNPSEGPPTFSLPRQCSISSLRRLPLIWLWFPLTIIALNLSYGCGRDRRVPGDAQRKTYKHLYGPATTTQQKLIDNVFWNIVRFHQLHEGPAPHIDWSKELADRTVSYQGEEVFTAEPLDIERVNAGLPPLGTGASVLASDVAEGYVRQCLLDPELLRRPDQECSLPSKPPRIWADDDVWIPLARSFVKHKICVVLGLKDIFHLNGIPCLNGMFGVASATGKKGLGKLRVVMNMIPSNGLFIVFEGDMPKLPQATQWFLCFVLDGEELRWSSDDLRCCFYVYRVDPAWHKYLAFSRPVPGHLVGRPDLREAYLAANVVPMGATWATGVVQHIHRRLLRVPRPCGAELSSLREIRRDRPWPQPEMLLERQQTTTPLRTTSGLVDTERFCALPLLLLWQVYLDNLDILEVWDCNDAAQLRPGDLSAQQQAARDAYDFHGIPRSEEKEEIRSSSTKALGHRVEGTLAHIGPPQLFVARLVHFTMTSLAGGPVSLKWLQILAGRWVRLFQYNRAVSHIFNALWRRIATMRGPKRLSTTIQSELVTAVLFLPFMCVDLRAPATGMVTCSDASLSGGAVCASTALTLEAEHCLSPTQSIAGFDSDTLLLISWDDDLGAGRRGAELAGTSPALAVAVVTSVDSRRCIQYTWPDTEFLEPDEALEVDRWKALLMRGPHLKYVWLIGQIKADDGDDGYKTVANLRRLLDILLSWIVPFEIFVSMETMANLDDKVSCALRATLQLQPWEMNSSLVSHADRQRLFWCSRGVAQPRFKADRGCVSRCLDKAGT